MRPTPTPSRARVRYRFKQLSDRRSGGKYQGRRRAGRVGGGAQPSESDFDVVLASQPVEPNLLGLRHFLHVHALGQLLSGLLEVG